MNRRQVLASAAICGTAALAGCTSMIHRVRGVDTPLTFVVESAAEDELSVDIVVERDGETVFDGSATFDEDGNLAGVDGDDFREASFDQAGKYTVVAETAVARDESTADISWRDLADCNGRGIQILLDDESVRVGFWQTDMDCGGLDRL